MKNKQKNAPAATEPTPDQSSNLDKAEQPAPVPFKLIPDFKISRKAKTMAKTAGIDLSSIEQMAPRMNEWASSVEDRLNALIEAIPQLPQRTVEVLRAEAQKQREQLQRQVQPVPQQTQGPNQGADLFSIFSQLAPFLAGGGGDSKLTELAMKSLEADISLSHTIKNAVSTRILAPITKEVADATKP